MDHKENLITKLELNDVDYTLKDGAILISFEPFVVKVKFEGEKASITTIITGWNHTTDFMQMEFKNALVYLVLKLCLLLGALLVLVYRYNEVLSNYRIFVLQSVVFLFIAVKLTFYIRYLIRIEHFKKSVIDWMQ